MWILPSLLAELTRLNTNAHRLYSAPHIWVERFGFDLLISHQAPELSDEFIDSAIAWSKQAGIRVDRIFGKHLPRQNADRIAPKLLRGDLALPTQTIVTEQGLQFGIDFEAGYSCGLFIDQRSNRGFLRQIAPKQLLNCFAYTCSFSVAAAAVGAKTVSLDLSRKSLDRGKANFELNNLSLEGHRFLADDVMEVLPRLARRKEKFDAIVLDPPTFSRGKKGQRWKVEEDFSTLIKEALEVADNPCSILLSTNCSRLTRRELEQIARPWIKAARVRCECHTEPPPPDIPEESAPKTLWLMIGR